MPSRIEPSADVASDASIGDGTVIWHLAQVRERAVLVCVAPVTIGACEYGERHGTLCPTVAA